MSRATVLSSIFLLMLGGLVFAQRAKDFEQAKKLSVQSGKPILLEFVHED